MRKVWKHTFVTFPLAEWSELPMWCVVHVRDQEEKNTKEFVSNLLPKNLNARCFHLTRSRRKKYGGQWHTVQENLFPGYVFIDTDQPEQVYQELKRAPRPRLLFSDEEYVSALEQQESDFMGMLADRSGDIGLSTVRVGSDGELSYVSGPLRMARDKVRKVNLHKRVAEIEADLMGQRRVLYLGIEIEGAG
ncbi:MAG: hypothetical protein HFG59_05140 [Lachnospiraceae bacterium]|nr:hypothetical protein [Lachnospiraceae bacterium]